MNRKLKILSMLLITVFVLTGLIGVSTSFAQQIPAPGTVIDKNNYKQYAHLFPEFMAQGFENGWGGLMPPLSITVAPTRSYPFMKSFRDMTEANRGKVTLDNEGYLLGFNYHGRPFPDLDKSDKDYATKIMWNLNYRIQPDDYFNKSVSFEHRKGESPKYSVLEQTGLRFINRMTINPKPDLDPKNPLEDTAIQQLTAPESLKNMVFLSYRYKDSRRIDDSFTYLPSIRRLVRGDADRRSTPTTGTLQAPDDFMGGFQGKISRFTYKLLGEKKVLGCPDSKLNYESLMKIYKEKKEVPYPKEGFEVRDVYVIEIYSKDPRYPQSKKVIWLDKETGNDIYYCEAWDRAGQPWKIWFSDFSRDARPDGYFTRSTVSVGLDLQFGMATCYGATNKPNIGKYRVSDFTTAAVLNKMK